MPIRLAGDWAPKTATVMPLKWHDLAVINLEGPVLNDLSGYEQNQKAGPCLYHTSLPSGIARIVYSLANNHIMDYGAKGLETTIDQIRHSKAYHCGASQNLNASRKPMIIENEGMRVGIISRCETQFGIASTEHPGACPIDATIHQTIKDLRVECDLLIVSLHAAAEMSPWPSPSRQDLCRAMIETGADIIHGHHSHIPQGWEKYKNGYIFYGLGNFCVDPSSWSSHPDSLWSLTPRLYNSGTDLYAEIKSSVIKIDSSSCVKISEASADEAKRHANYLEICNKPLSDRGLLESLWQEVAIDLYQKHFGPWLGLIARQERRSSKSYSLRKISARAKQLLRSYKATYRISDSINRYNQMLIYHLFACESHSDAISTALGVLSGVVPDKRSLASKAMLSEYSSQADKSIH